MVVLSDRPASHLINLTILLDIHDDNIEGRYHYGRLCSTVSASTVTFLVFCQHVLVTTMLTGGPLCVRCFDERGNRHT